MTLETLIAGLESDLKYKFFMTDEEALEAGEIIKLRLFGWSETLKTIADAKESVFGYDHPERYMINMARNAIGWHVGQ